MYQVVNNLSHQAGAACVQGRRRLPLQRRSDHLSALGSRELYASHRWRTSWPASTTTRALLRHSAPSEVSQTNPNLGVYVQDEWKVSPRVTLNLGVRYDLQFLETINTDTNNISPRARRGLVALRLAPHGRPRQRRPLLRPRSAPRGRERHPVGGKHDRPHQPAPDRRESFPHASRRADVPEHPQRRRPVGHAGQPDDDGPESAERVFAAGQRRGRAAARGTHHGQRRVSVSARTASAHVREPERADLRRLGHQQRLPAEPELREQQSVLLGWGVQLSRVARLVHAAAGAMGQLSDLVHACRNR